MAFTTTADVVIEADTVVSSENIASWGGIATSLGQKTMANSVPVVLASNQSAVPVSGSITANPPTSTTGTRTDIAQSSVSQIFLASNVSRKGATVYNDALTNLFLKLGATASSSDFIVRLSTQDYYEVPFNYTGRIDGIWASAGAGNARITELT